MVLSMMRGVLVLLLWAVVLAGPAAAQSIVERSYTWDKLNAFWGRTLGADGPDIAAFEPFAPTAPEVPAALPVLPDFGVPLPGEVIGETPTGTQNGGQALVRFPVIPLDPAVAGPLMRRLAWAELYLARYRSFEAISTDPAEALANLEARQWAAMIEVYLTHARLFYAAASLPDKCIRVRRLHAVAALVPDAAPTMPTAWAALWPIFQAAQGRVEGEALAVLSCSVNPVQGRAETLRKIEERVQARIALAARDKVQENLTLLNQAATEFQTLVNAMDVEIKTAEILQLERDFGNAASSLRMVAEDDLSADVTIGALDEVDLSTLARPGESGDLDAARAQMAGMIATIDAVLGAIADMSETDPEFAAQFTDCETLRGLYPTLDLTLDTGVLTELVEAPYDNCLMAARALVDTQNAPSLDAVMLAEFARHLAQLSEVYIASITQ